MLKKYLVTVQEPGNIRLRLLVAADSTFATMAKVMDNPVFNVDSYVAARPATMQDIDTYAEWTL